MELASAMMRIHCERYMEKYFDDVINITVMSFDKEAKIMEGTINDLHYKVCYEGRGGVVIYNNSGIGTVYGVASWLNYINNEGYLDIDKVNRGEYGKIIYNAFMTALTKGFY